MADPAAGVLAAALFVLAGWPWSVLSPRIRGAPPAARIGWAYLLGYAWTAAASFVLSHLRLAPLTGATFVGLAPLAWLIAGAARFLGRGSHSAARGVEARRPRRPWTWWTALASLVVILTCVAVAALASSRPVGDWDGRMTWGPAARWMCAERTVDPSVLTQRRWYVSHPDYPPLAPVADCVAIALAGRREGAEPFRLLYALMLPAILAVIWTGTRSWAGRRAAWLAATLVALAPFPVWNSDGGATGAYSDLALAAFFGGGLVLVLRARRLGDGLAGGLLLSAAALVKSEGRWLALAVLVLGGAVAIAGRALSRRRIRPYLATLCLVAASLAALSHWQRGIPARGDEDYGVLLRRAAPTLAARSLLFEALPEMLDRMAAPGDWSLAWWIAPAILLLGRRGWARRRHVPLILAAASPLAIGVLAYAVQRDPATLAAVTWNRFLVQAMVPLVLVLALAGRAASGRPKPAPAWDSSG